MELIIATRKSNLAQIQADRVIELLKEKEGITGRKLLMMTEGDLRLDVSLDKIGGKGVFTKNIEGALAEGKADAAVHSMKDVPYEINSIFEITAIPEREDVRDTFVSNKGVHFEELIRGSRIGTSSIRRGQLIKSIRPDIEIVPIRGNVETRLKKMKELELDGIVLAAAGLKRIGREDIVTDYFDPEIVLPAVGQGALGIECLKSSNTKGYFRALNSEEAEIEVLGERSFMKRLNGDCHSPIGIYTKTEGRDIYMVGIYEVFGRLIKKDIYGNKCDAVELGKRLAEKILSTGR